MSAKKRKNMDKTTAAKLVAIRDVDTTERSKMAQPYGIPLSTLPTYFKKRDS
jgi:hypothetical protein